MSELITTHDNRATIHWKLLTGASALALVGYVSSATVVKAEDASHALIWIELGGQFSQLADSEEQYTPPFILATPRPAPEKKSPLLGNPMRFSFDEDAAISFQPAESDWVFSAAIRFGRSKGSKNIHQESYPTQPVVPPITPSALPFWQYALPFSDAKKTRKEKHTILDFQAGKDVGLGKFGADGTSTVSVGVRFAQFRSRSSTTFKTQPDWQPSITHCITPYLCNLTGGTFYGIPFTQITPFKTLLPISVFNGARYHLNAGMWWASRSFRGVGPSISWKASAPIAGNSASGEIALDWGVNAALLFGRQKTKVHHQTTEWYHAGGRYPGGGGGGTVVFRTTVGTPVNVSRARSRNIAVPNVGGSLGISWNYRDAKISFGYKADFFFNAIDGGIDSRKSENRAFFGPYASISIGIGD